MTAKKYAFSKTEDQWKADLSEEEYRVLREKGTERPFTGAFNDHNEDGVYVCKGCNEELFLSNNKFDSGCGWPSFDNEIEGNKVYKQSDETLGMRRVEILCNNCGGHLGHIFNDGPTKTKMRYCVNSASLDFKGKQTPITG